VADILRSSRDQSETTLITATEVAVRFGVSRTWVYDNAEALGVIRLGTGAKARLRFEPTQVVRFIESRSSQGDAAEHRSPSRRTRWLDTADLIPIRGN
jgi:hypothetical protein